MQRRGKPFCRFAAWIADSEPHIKRIPVKVSFVDNTLMCWLIVKYAFPRPLRLGIEPSFIGRARESIRCYVLGGWVGPCALVSFTRGLWQYL